MNKITKMKVVGFFEGLSIEQPESFVENWQEIPVPKPRDILVKVQAVSINPVDSKLRRGTPKSKTMKIVGFDGVGKVVAQGKEVTKFKKGDRVFYAGAADRQGSHQEYQLVDERIAALAPKKWTDEEAAALPLTTLTAYELLFEKFHLFPEKNKNQGKSILVINGAGGVGSVLTQLARWAGLEVFATASPKNFPWLKAHGVIHPLDHHENLVQSLQKIGVQQVDHVAVLYDITRYFDQITELIAPFGHVGTIVGIDQPLPIGAWKNRSVSFDWEYMFAKTAFNERIETQGEILAHIAALADAGELKTTVNKVYATGINAETIKKATQEVEAGHTVGKVVVSGGFR